MVLQPVFIKEEDMYIKEEPGLEHRPARSLATPESTVDGLSETASERVMRLRHVRSDAPSISTRIRAPSVSSRLPAEAEDDGDDCVMLEIKSTRRLQSEPSILASQSMQGSFIGANRALRDFGEKLKYIHDALGELQSRGIQHVASLPELVLVGDQSSGKSSLMSAIAGLSLPRSSGTCTRCPIHIRVSRADEWSCRVFLKYDYEFRPPSRPLTERDVTRENKFPPWVPLGPGRQTRNEFKTVRDQHDAEEIETVLRCAQVAILNPSTPYQRFAPKLKSETPDGSGPHIPELVKMKEERSEAQFSPNTVALELKGPDLSDLNFYDLPGVFMTARRQQDIFLEKVVQNLTNEYISRPNAIIMCAVPMNQDTENSLALKLIRRQRAENRCIGVMTKADLLPKDDDAAKNWLAMLDGQAHPTGHGYFITSRQGKDLEMQNKMEEAFFNRTADVPGHWPSEFDKFKERCGVDKLKAFLSRKLGEEFAKMLPEVKDKVNSRLQDLERQLMEYPDPPPNPELEIMKSLTEFTIRVKDRVLHQDFLSTWDTQCGEPFKEAIMKGKPKFNVRDNARPVTTPKTARVVIDLDGPSPATTPSGRKRHATPAADMTQNTPKRQRSQQIVNGQVKTEPADNSAIPSTPQHPRMGPPPSATPSRRSGSRSLMDLRNLIRRTAIPGQPGLVSSTVYEPLFLEAARSWAQHIETFVDLTLGILHTEIMNILNTAFAHLNNRAVYKESIAHMQAFMEGLKTELRDQLQLIYRLESSRLFTKDEETLKRHQAAEMKILMRHRNHCRIAAHNGEEPTAVPKMEEMTEEQIRQEEARIAKDIKALGPDPFEPELEVAAYIRGYYLTAANRFVDYACIHVMSGLLPRVASVIDTYLHEKLGLLSGGRATSQEVLQRLMSEGPEIEQKRRDLRAEKETLDGAMDIIINLERREREQAAAAASQYAASTMSQAESMATLDAGAGGVNGGPGTAYASTAFGEV